MGRGRTPQTSKLQVLLEILLVRDRAVFGSEIAENVDVGKERVRQLCASLAEQGYVKINEVSGRKVYRLTDEGYAYLAAELREAIN
jgi:predicted transcriptional regulator